MNELALFAGVYTGLRELALFAGAGGGILGGKLLGWRTVCAVEIDEYARRVLMERQNDGCLPPFPIWDDICTFDGRPWRGVVDLISGGFPCQDISAAGRGEGIQGARSGLWSEMARIIGEVGPRYVLVENSPILTSRGLGTVLGDLASMGYDARWGVLGASDAIWSLGNPAVDHDRARIWIVAAGTNADGVRKLQPERCEQAQWRRAGNVGKEAAYANGARCEKLDVPAIAAGSGQHNRLHNSVCHADRIDGREGAGGKNRAETRHTNWWGAEPELGRVANGVARRVDRLRCIGNGQVPAVVALAWRTLSGE